MTLVRHPPGLDLRFHLRLHPGALHPTGVLAPALAGGHPGFPRGVAAGDDVPLVVAAVLSCGVAAAAGVAALRGVAQTDRIAVDVVGIVAPGTGA